MFSLRVYIQWLVFLFVFCFVFPDLHLGVKKNIFIYGSSLAIASQVKCFSYDDGGDETLFLQGSSFNLFC